MAPRPSKKRKAHVEPEKCTCVDGYVLYRSKYGRLEKTSCPKCGGKGTVPIAICELQRTKKRKVSR